MAITFSFPLVINCKLITPYFTGLILHLESYMFQVTTEQVWDFQWGPGNVCLRTAALRVTFLQLRNPRSHRTLQMLRLFCNRGWKKTIRRFIQDRKLLYWNVQSVVGKQRVLEMTPTITIDFENNPNKILEELGYLPSFKCFNLQGGTNKIYKSIIMLLSGTFLFLISTSTNSSFVISASNNF
jgi:hypothetical protein